MRDISIGVALGLALIGAFLCSCGGGGNGAPDGGTDSDTDADAGAPAGSLTWAQHLGGSDYVGSSAWHIGNLGRSVSALSGGSFYAGGSFVNEAVFGAGTSNEVTLQSAGGFWDADAFIGRWRSDGAPDWVISVGGDEPGIGMETLLDTAGRFTTRPDDRLFAMVSVEDGANLDPLGEDPVNLADDDPCVVATYDVDGRLGQYMDIPAFCWVSEAHGPVFSSGPPIVIANDGAFAIAGGIPAGPTTFGAGEPNETTLTPDPDGVADGTYGAAVAVYEADDTLKWAVMIDNGAHDVGIDVNEIAVGPNGEIIAAGYYGAGYAGAEALIYGTDGEVISVGFWDDPEVDETASFLAKWSPEGIVEWVKQIPPIYGSAPLFARDDGTIMLMHTYLDGVTFDPGGPGEAVIDHGPCTTQFCFFSVEIAPDGSSFEPHLMDGGGSYIAMRPDGSFALAGSYVVRGYGADYAKLWEAKIDTVETGDAYGAWIHDVAALADGSIVVIGDYTGSIVLGQGEPNETVLHGVCDECLYGAFLARYAW